MDANGFDATEPEFDPEDVIQWGFISQWNDDPRGQSSLFGAANPIDDEGNAMIPESWRVGLQWFYDGIWVDHFIPNASQNGSDLLANGNAFSSGNVAMAHTHLWYTCCLGEVTDDWDIAVVPAYEGVYTAKLHGDTFRILNTTEHPAEAFEVLAYLLGEASPTLLQVYGGMPARAEDTEAFFATLDEQYPQDVNWSVAVASLAYADSPNHESFLPNFNRVRDLLNALEAEYESTPDLDLQARLDTLQAELQALYDSAGEDATTE